MFFVIILLNISQIYTEAEGMCAMSIKMKEVVGNSTDIIPELFQAQVPVMDRRQFASQVGLTLDTVESMISRGYLPCVRIGKRSLINLALLNQRCLDKEFSL